MTWQAADLTPPLPESPGPPTNPSTELVELYGRVENGIRWLIEHDPSGSFDTWFRAGLTALSPMPAQDAARRDEWRAYHSARTTFETLWRKMVRLEKAAAT